MRIKVKITIVAEVESYEYHLAKTIVEELGSETDYSIGDTDGVKVLNTELVDVEKIGEG